MLACHHYSRWEIGEQPQLVNGLNEEIGIIADGRSGSNRNITTDILDAMGIIADGRSGSNRNT